MFDDAEVHDQRQVIRRRADELASRHLDAEHVDRSAAENMVYAQHRHARGKGSSRPLVQHELGIAQPGREHAIDDDRRLALKSPSRITGSLQSGWPIQFCPSRVFACAMRS